MGTCLTIPFLEKSNSPKLFSGNAFTGFPVKTENLIPAEKSTLWTNTGQDCSFQRILSAIGPYEFWGNSYGPIIGPYLFLGKFVWTNGPESF